MPELPEVETVRKALKNKVLNKKNKIKQKIVEMLIKKLNIELEQLIQLVILLGRLKVIS